MFEMFEELHIIDDVNKTNEINFDLLNEKCIHKKIEKFKNEILYFIKYDFKNEYDNESELENLKFVTTYGNNKHAYLFKLSTSICIFWIHVYDYSIFNENKFNVQFVLYDSITGKKLNTKGMYYTDLVLDY
jgi:hypothetical protein